MMIDLQIHTDCSDGLLPLKTIIQQALEERLSYIAITDHDSIDSWRKEALHQIGIPAENMKVGYFMINNMCVIQGEEITCDYKGYEVHLLAYFLTEDAVEKSEIKLHNNRMTIAMDERAKWVINQLKKANFKIEYNDLAGKVKSPKAFSYAFIAEELLKTNLERIKQLMPEKANPSIDDVLYGILKSKGSPFYKPINNFYRDERGNLVAFLTLKKAIELVMDVGAVPVISHPGLYTFLATQNSSQSEIKAETLITDLMIWSDNLAGIEVYNRRHKPHIIEAWYDYAKHMHLLITAGSDFHGYKDAHMGVFASPDIIEHLKQHHDIINEYFKSKAL